MIVITASEQPDRCGDFGIGDLAIAGGHVSQHGFVLLLCAGLGLRDQEINALALVAVKIAAKTGEFGKVVEAGAEIAPFIDGCQGGDLGLVAGGDIAVEFRTKRSFGFILSVERIASAAAPARVILDSDGIEAGQHDFGVSYCLARNRFAEHI